MSEDSNQFNAEQATRSDRFVRHFLVKDGRPMLIVESADSGPGVLGEDRDLKTRKTVDDGQGFVETCNRSGAEDLSPTLTWSNHW